jgi:hypothetical protein
MTLTGHGLQSYITVELEEITTFRRTLRPQRFRLRLADIPGFIIEAWYAHLIFCFLDYHSSPEDRGNMFAET